jgi:hypothetical protein
MKFQMPRKGTRQVLCNPDEWTQGNGPTITIGQFRSRDGSVHVYFSDYDDGCFDIAMVSWDAATRFVNNCPVYVEREWILSIPRRVF